MGTHPAIPRIARAGAYSPVAAFAP
jgi:hypothetical protein